MIPELLEGPLDDNTVMVLLNAISFDAKWESKFSTGTGLLPFNGASGTKDVPYLFGLGQTLIRGYGEGFYKRYEGGNYAFAAILPLISSQSPSPAIRATSHRPLKAVAD